MPLAAIGQIRSTSSPTSNLIQCLHLVTLAFRASASALFLPEASDYIAPNATTSLSICQPLATSPFVQGLRTAARTHSLPICVGVHTPSPTNPNKVCNTLLWINASGAIAAQYDKLHLFDVDIAGGPVLKESASVERGTQLEDPLATPLGKVGLLICFDLRFPEPSLALRRRGAQILTYPSAFTVPTGRAHWETLLRARAIETQSYVIAAAQCGYHDEGKTRRSYGHSMIVDPWGKVVAELGGVDEEIEEGSGLNEGEIALAEIDLEVVERVRREVPLMRRTDVYADVV
ncbi:carbon-nitrogen hydrolase [Massariosphaeria phaeospora]|uniref:Carbon-nitrogen hydrolase n=1 Tax=Massariosphaeria phaeospora TaxID=100035 RepID=A0A7C8I759_9PLEO|nr:carbon-nitrogen hydrolase [Massariosphaeria phaeospora]